MKKPYFIACFLFLYLTGFAEQSKLDSLLTLLKQHPQEDTTQINLLASISNTYCEIDPGQGLIFSDKAIALSKKLGNQRKLGLSYAMKGFNFEANGENEKAIEMFLLSLTAHESINNKPAVGRMSHNIGNAYFNVSNFSEAVKYYEKAKNIFEEMKDSVSLAIVYNGLGTAHEYLSNYTISVEYFLNALQLYHRAGNENQNGLTEVYINLGSLYRELSLFNTALSYYDTTLSIHTRNGNELGISNVYNSIGNLYDDMDDQTKALEFYNKSLDINKSLGNEHGIAGNLTNLGVIYSSQKKYAIAWDYLQQALSEFERRGNKSSACTVLNELGRICTNAPDSFLRNRNIPPSQRYNKALTYLKKSLRLAQEIEAVNQETFAYEALIKTYEAKKDIVNAFEASKRYIHLHDSLMSDETKSEITKKEGQFEFDRKESLLKTEHEKKEALSTAEIKRQRVVKNSAMGIAAVILLAASFSFVFYKRRRDAEKEKVESDFKARVSDTEMKALRSQMNPHFIFNSLNSIADFIAHNDTKAADNYLLKFAKVMRMILENSEQKEVSISDDLNALELYMQLESLRMKNKFSYEIKTDDDIDLENTMIPPLILQPFVENSIWHGISKKEGQGHISIKIKKSGDMIKCIVEDNGIGRSKSVSWKEESEKQEKKSLGMKITNARIEIINKLKGSKAGVELSDLTEGLKVVVSLPLELKF